MRARLGVFAALPLVLTACAANPVALPRMASVDLPRFMGDWYVIAHVPSWPERHAHNAIESYVLDADGTIRTTFRYRNAPDGRLKVMRPKGWAVPDSGNAVWGMQFIWPIRAEYVIAYVDADYQETIVARSKRDYAWIMARTPTLSPERYEALLARLLALGYKPEDVRQVPQAWPEAGFPLGREPVQ
jgi:apolipoprotein D and lipocalin family protein